MSFDTETKRPAMLGLTLGAVVALEGVPCKSITLLVPLSGNPSTVGENAIDFDQDGIDDLAIGGSSVCTRGFPKTVCADSLMIRAREDIASLLADFPSPSLNGRAGRPPHPRNVSRYSSSG